MISDDYVEAIVNAGGEVYIVGGAIRNCLYNKFHNTNISIKDYDFLVRLINISELTKILKKYGTVKEDIGESFGITIFIPFNSVQNVEFALPRTEFSTGSGYKDFIINADHNITITEDFSRRDATINAMAIKVNNLIDIDKITRQEIIIDEVIDPFNGINDIKNKMWKCVGDPNKRFVEDPNRIMRAFRQSAELNLSIELNSLLAIKNDYHLMRELIPKSYVRLFNEFFKMINVNNHQMINNLIEMNTIGIMDLLGIHNAETNINFNSNTIIKIAMILNIPKFNENIKKWGHFRQITATNNFTPTDMIILTSIQNFYKDFIEIDSLYQMLKQIEKIYKFNGSNYINIINNIIEYDFEMSFITLEKMSELKNYLEQSTKYPSTTDQLLINGNMLIEKWNITTSKIKKTKDLLLDMIYKNELINELECLTNYLNKAIKI